MEVKRVIIPYHRPDVFRFYPYGDSHFGTKHCHEKAAINKLQQITNDPFAFWFDMGDKCEFITPSDTRWSEGTVSDWVKKDDIAMSQAMFYCDVARQSTQAEIADYGVRKCVGSLWGNHEEAIRKHNHDNVQAWICRELKTDNLGFSCVLELIFRRINSNEAHLFKGFLTHGSGNCQTRGGKLMKLRKIMNQVDCRFVCVAHMHDIIIEPQIILETDQNEHLKGCKKLGCITGSFLRTYTQGVYAGYGEQRNLDPVPIGCPVITFYPNENRMTMSEE